MSVPYFRFLEFFPPGWYFVITSVLIRVVHAAGNALVITATFTYAAVEFQQAVGQIFVSLSSKSTVVMLLMYPDRSSLCPTYENLVVDIVYFLEDFHNLSWVSQFSQFCKVLRPYLKQQQQKFNIFLKLNTILSQLRTWRTKLLTHLSRSPGLL